MHQATLDEKRDALDALVLLEEQGAELYARKALALVEVAGLFRPEDPATAFVVMDLALRLQIAQVTAANRLRTAQHLVQQLPATTGLLLRSELTIGQAQALIEETLDLPTETVTKVEARVLPRIKGLTPGDTAVRSSAPSSRSTPPPPKPAGRPRSKPARSSTPPAPTAARCSAPT